MIEDFERDDPLADYEGLVEYAAIQSHTVYEGEQALIFDWEGDDPAAATIHRPDLEIERDNENEVYFNNPEVNNFIAVHYLAQEEPAVEGTWDVPDGYTVGIAAADECLKLWVREVPTFTS